MERSPPSRATRPLPRGMGSRLETSPFMPSRTFCSKYMTGLSSSMAESMRPRASCAQEGYTTFRPGTWVSQASRLWECCAAAPVPAPAGRRTTIGIEILPPNI